MIEASIFLPFDLNIMTSNLAFNKQSVPIKKFKALLDDIFEAEDSLSPDLDLADLPHSFRTFFSTFTTDSSRPLLRNSIMAKIAQTIAQVTRPSKRSRRQAMATPRKARGGQGEGGVYEDATSLAEMDQALLGRLLKVLERNVALGEDLDPFAGAPASAATAGNASPSKKKPAKTKKLKAKSKSSKALAPDGTRRSSSRCRSGSARSGEASDGEDNDAEREAEAQDVTEDQLYKLGEDIEKAKASVIAAGCCIGLLAADALSKQVSCLPRRAVGSDGAN